MNKYRTLVKDNGDYDLEFFGLAVKGEEKKIVFEKGIWWIKNKLTIG